MYCGYPELWGGGAILNVTMTLSAPKKVWRCPLSVMPNNSRMPSISTALL